jgi:ABC-type glycerol-3-phosphate transport system substrate-binding protein
MSLPEKPPVFNNLALFQQETGITVNLTVLDESDVDTKAAALYAAGSSEYDLIDASFFGAYSFADYANGYIQPLNSFVDQTPTGWNKGDLQPLVFQAMTYPDGSLTSLPIVFANSGMWYSASTFKAAGAQTPFGGSCQVSGTPTPGAPPRGMYWRVAT